MSEREHAILRAVSRVMEPTGPSDPRTNADKRTEAIQAVATALKCPPLEATAITDRVLREALFEG
ncbi:MAG TPA: hypothetical protein PKZ07_16125 [Sedimentisphaerales bacterium]|nr:hypothetical protein [Sedimentisphaerales bacterium]